MARRQYLRWTPDLQDRFLDAVEKLGGLEMATPSRIALLMQVRPGADPDSNFVIAPVNVGIHYCQLPTCQCKPSMLVWLRLACGPNTR